VQVYSDHTTNTKRYTDSYSEIAISVPFCVCSMVRVHLHPSLFLFNFKMGKPISNNRAVTSFSLCNSFLAYANNKVRE